MKKLCEQMLKDFSQKYRYENSYEQNYSDKIYDKICKSFLKNNVNNEGKLTIAYPKEILGTSITSVYNSLPFTYLLAGSEVR